MAKGIRASTPHHTTSRAAAPLYVVHIDTAGPFPESLGGSRYVVLFVDSASHFQRPYVARGKSASAILDVLQRFVANMGVPRAFRTDNGAEYTNSTFVEYCNSLRIRRKLTAPYTPQQNGLVESGLSRAIKAGDPARLEVNKLFPDVHLDRLKGVRDPYGSSLWMESVLWASEGFNRSATTANSGMVSPDEVFFGDSSPMPVLPFCKPAYHRVPRQSKLAYRLPPPATCRSRLPLSRWNHRSTMRYGVIPGHGSSAACCRSTRSAPRSNQSVMSLTRSGCSVEVRRVRLDK